MRGVSKAACLRRWLLVAAGLAAVIPTAGQAQLGGLRKLKQKVEQAVGEKPAAASEDDPQQRSPYSENVLEITPEVADCLERALAAENAELAAFKSWAAKVKSEDQYQACSTQSMMSPEGQAISAEMTAALDKGQQAAMQAMQTAQVKLEALTEKYCGPQPRKVEERRREAQAAAQKKGMQACGYTERQYFILKERLTPGCTSELLAQADGALKLPGDGTGMFWVYSPAEVKVLKTRCGRLVALLKQQL
ncbi:MAG: hypothetical protein FIB01_15560 [Gemmatimonadetes bacterium]|nr:hypothetical protein [Gemmatimonadota bacterium]